MNIKDFNYIIDDIIKNISNDSSILTHDDIDNIFMVIKDKHDINKLNYVMNTIKHNINKKRFNLTDIFRLKNINSKTDVKEGFVEGNMNKDVNSFNKKIVDSIEMIIWDKNKNPADIIIKNIYNTFLDLFEELLLIIVSSIIITNIFVIKRDIPRDIMYPSDPSKFPYVYYDGGDITNDKTAKSLVTCELMNKENYSKYEKIFDIVTTNQSRKPDKNSNGSIDVQEEECKINNLNDKDKCPNNKSLDDYDIDIINSFHEPNKDNMNFFAKMFQNYNANRTPIQVWPSSLFSYIFLFTTIKLNLFMKSIHKNIPNLLKLKNENIDISKSIVWVILVFLLYYLLKKVDFNIRGFLPKDAKKGEVLYELLYLILRITETFVKPTIFFFGLLFIMIYIITCGYMCLGLTKYASAIKNKDAPIMYIYTLWFCFPIVLVQFLYAAYELYKYLYSIIYCGAKSVGKSGSGGDGKSNKSDDKYSKEFQGKKSRGSAAIEEDYQRIYQILLNDVQKNDGDDGVLTSNGIYLNNDNYSSDFTNSSKNELEKLNAENKFKLYNNENKKGKKYEKRDIYRKKIRILTELHIEREKFIFGDVTDDDDREYILRAIFNNDAYNNKWASREWKNLSNIKDNSSSTPDERAKSYLHYRNAMKASVTNQGDLNTLKTTSEFNEQEIDALSDNSPFNSFQVGGGGGNDEDVERISDKNYGYRPLFDEDGNNRTREFVYDLWTLSDLHFNEYRNYVNKLDKCSHESRFNYEKVTNGNKLAKKFSNYKKKCKKKKKFKEAFTTSREGFGTQREGLTSCAAIKKENKKINPEYRFIYFLFTILTLPLIIPGLLPTIIAGYNSFMFSIGITLSHFGYFEKIMSIFGLKNIKLSFILLFLISIIHIIYECISHKYFLIRVPTLIILLISLFTIDIVSSKNLKNLINDFKKSTANSEEE